MKKVAIDIISAAKIYAPIKIEDLEDKRLVPKMMLRRRLTRTTKIMLFLADKCAFEGGKIVYSSTYGELQASAGITSSILHKEPISPTLFQNSVYNTAPSYFSLLNKDKNEIITLSSGRKGSLEALKTAALQALISQEEVLCIACESLDIENINQVNSCAKYLESGAAVILKIADDAHGALEIEDIKEEGILESIQDLLSVVSMSEQGKSKIFIEL